MSARQATVVALILGVLAGTLSACSDSKPELASPRRGVVTMIVPAPGFDRISSLLVGPDGKLYVGGRGGANVFPAKGTERVLYRTVGERTRIQGIALGKDVVYLSETSDRTVRAITPNGGVLNVAGNGDSAIPTDGAPAAHSPLACPWSLHYDTKASELVIREATQFRRIDKDGLIHTFGIGGKTAEELCKIGTYGLAATEDGEYLFARSTFVVRFGGDVVFYPPEGPNANPRAFDDITDLAYDPLSKSIYVADNTRIKRIAADGTISVVAGTNSDKASEADGPPLTTALGEVEAIAVDRKGNLYFAAGYPPTIRALGAPSGNRAP